MAWNVGSGVLSDRFGPQPSVPGPLLLARYGANLWPLGGRGEGPSASASGSGPHGDSAGAARPAPAAAPGRRGPRAGECGPALESSPPGSKRPPSRRSPRRAVSLAVHFRYVVFHPFLDEILIGKIKGCSPEGVHGNGP